MIGFGSIHAFKGLEAKTVVLTDIDDIETQRAIDLLYVGITRSLSRLALLFHESVKPDVMNVVSRAMRSR